MPGICKLTLFVVYTYVNDLDTPVDYPGECDLDIKKQATLDSGQRVMFRMTNNDWSKVFKTDDFGKITVPKPYRRMRPMTAVI